MSKTTGSILVLIFLYTLGAYQRNNIWLEETTIWADTTRKAPHKARPHFGLGYSYLNKGHYNKAIEELKKSVKLNPAYSEAHCHLGIAYKKRGCIKRQSRHLKIHCSIALPHGGPITI